MDNANATDNQQQQFCLRWHNHQTSLLGSLPLLLDQSHLTDVTLCTEGKMLRAHRVVLSACSAFFSELFHTLDSTSHPVIIIPGASFSAMAALLTFMYSGEVNVFENQISTLLTLAETLGIKGLADFQNNNPSKSFKAESSDNNKDRDTTPTSSPTPAKISSSLENFFLKSFELYPNLIPQPLNFSQSALNKTSEFLAKYQYNILQASKDISDSNDNMIKTQSNINDKKFKEPKKIEKIVENLRTCTGLKGPIETDMITQITKMSMNLPTQGIMKPPLFCANVQHFLSDDNSKMTDPADQKQANIHSFNDSEGMTGVPSESLLEKTITNPIQQSKIANSKLYATCFICHKQLSNQYNLRVHLETHQNVRYACSVCSHVSRSKDALRKHVSYRHPGAPSPCESEARRKRSKAGMSTTTAFSPVLKSEAEDQISTNPFLFIPNPINQFSPQISPVVSTHNTSSNINILNPEDSLAKFDASPKVHGNHITSTENSKH